MSAGASSASPPLASRLAQGRGRWRTAPAFAVAGVAAGIASKLADAAPVDGIADLGTSPTLWILVLAIVGRLAPSPTAAVLRATVFFVGMCLGYYAWTALVLHYPGSGPLLVAWLGLALTVVPVGAFLVTFARDRKDVVAGVVFGGLAGLAATDPALVQMWYRITGDLPASFPVHPIQAVAVVVTIVTIIAWVPTKAAGRLWSALLLVPASYAASWLLELASGRLIPG